MEADFADNALWQLQARLASKSLAPLPDADPPAGLAERAGPKAVAAARRLFGGDFSAEATETFERLVFPHYAAPGRQEVPLPLIALSTLSPEIAGHFFTHLAPHYDVRLRLPEIAAPTLVVVGRHDWVCPPAGGRALADGIPDAHLVELPDAGHLGFAETPGPFLAAVRAHLARVERRRPPSAAG